MNESFDEPSTDTRRARTFVDWLTRVAAVVMVSHGAVAWAQDAHQFDALPVRSEAQGNLVVSSEQGVVCIRPLVAGRTMTSFELAPTGWQAVDVQAAPGASSNGHGSLASADMRGEWIALGLPKYRSFAGAVFMQRIIDREFVGDPRYIPGGGTFHGFGSDVALGDGLLVVGAPTENSPSWEREGACYVFELIDDEWVPVQRLTPPPALVSVDGYRFGVDVEISGSSLFVSAVHFDLEGRLLEYAMDASGQYVFQRTIEAPPSPGYRGRFGSEVAQLGDELAVTEGGSSDVRGRVHLFDRSSTGDCVHRQSLRSGLVGGTSFGGNYFGTQLFLDESCLLAADTVAPNESAHRGGVLYFERRADGGFHETHDHKFSVGGIGGHSNSVGASCAVHGRQLLVALGSTSLTVPCVLAFSLDRGSVVCSGLQRTDGRRLWARGVGVGLFDEFAVQGVSRGAHVALLASTELAARPSTALPDLGGLCLGGHVVMVGRTTAELTEDACIIVADALTDEARRLFGVVDTVYLQPVELHGGRWTAGDCTRYDVQR